jgi:hypothetical protein
MRCAVKKHCIPNSERKRTLFDDIAVIVFAFEKKDHLLTTDKKKGIDLRPTPEELRSNKLESEKDERLRNIVHFFSNAARDLKVINAAGLTNTYKSKVEFIAGPYTCYKGEKDKKENIQTPDLKQIQLCLRGHDLKAKFEQIMNPIWFSLKIPKEYSQILSTNIIEERKRMEANDGTRASQNVKDYGKEFSRKSFLKFLSANRGKTKK